MSQQDGSFACGRARRYVMWPAILIALAASIASAGEPLTLQEVKTRLERQQQRIESLQLRVRRETTLSVKPKDMLGWSRGPALPKYIGKDEVLVAFKGDRRYFRVLALDYAPTSDTRSSSATGKIDKPYVDEAKAWNGTALALSVQYRMGSPRSDRGRQVAAESSADVPSA